MNDSGHNKKQMLALKDVEESMQNLFSSQKNSVSIVAEMGATLDKFLKDSRDREEAIHHITSHIAAELNGLPSLLSHTMKTTIQNILIDQKDLSVISSVNNTGCERDTDQRPIDTTRFCSASFVPQQSSLQRTEFSGDSEHTADKQTTQKALERPTLEASFSQSIINKRFRKSTNRTYATWLGEIRVQTIKAFDEVWSELDHEYPSPFPETSWAHTHILIFPRPWLLRRGITARYEQVYSSKSINFTLRQFSTVPNDSPAFRACECGDLDALKQEFRRGSASPMDRNMVGLTLLDVSFASIITLLQSWRDDSTTTGNGNSIQQKVENSLETIVFCIKHGLDPGAIAENLPDLGDKPALERLLDIDQQSICHLRSRASQVHRLTSLILDHSEQDPFYNVELGELYRGSWFVSEFTVAAAILSQESWHVDWNAIATERVTQTRLINMTSDLFNLIRPPFIPTALDWSPGESQRPPFIPTTFDWSLAESQRATDRKQCKLFSLALSSGLDPAIIREAGREDWDGGANNGSLLPWHCLSTDGRSGTTAISGVSFPNILDSV
jgi:hypothetical protein